MFLPSSDSLVPQCSILKALGFCLNSSVHVYAKLPSGCKYGLLLDDVPLWMFSCRRDWAGSGRLLVRLAKLVGSSSLKDLIPFTEARRVSGGNDNWWMDACQFAVKLYVVESGSSNRFANPGPGGQSGGLKQMPPQQHVAFSWVLTAYHQDLASANDELIGFVPHDAAGRCTIWVADGRAIPRASLQ
ncbi:hypothetical protein MIR68_007646 [Amoeboaphelidium protococcarum]|nr:hypothetical protein MIR68_007646 [Amoeboaphelidium protococcarum]